jgi:hypothetical protein
MTTKLNTHCTMTQLALALPSGTACFTTIRSWKGSAQTREIAKTTTKTTSFISFRVDSNPAWSGLLTSLFECTSGKHLSECLGLVVEIDSEPCGGVTCRRCQRTFTNGVESSVAMNMMDRIYLGPKPDGMGREEKRYGVW